MMKDILKLMKQYQKINAPPCTIIVGDTYYTEEKLVLGKAHS